MTERLNGWKKTQRVLAVLALCGTVAASLQGCIGVMMGGAVAGVMAASDRRTLGAQTEDKTIAVKGETRIPKLIGDEGHVNVTSYNRKVLLTGEVKDEQMRQAVENEVASIEGVTSVTNDLAIAGASSFTSRSNDTLITGKVKASLVDNKQISANIIKVVTERSIVYLMGRVTEREGAIAAEVARGVSGVQKVVKVFEYISDDEARQYNGSAS